MKVCVSQVTKRIEQSLLQVCNAAYGNKDLACKTMRTLLRKCLIDDDHSICVKVSGEYCPCHIDKGMRDANNRFLIKTGKGGLVHAMQAILDMALDKKYNAYLCGERMAQAAAGSGCDAFVAAPRISACKRKTTDDPPESQPDDPKNSVSVDSQNSGDPLQPYVSQLTHPLAIQILMDFIQSKDLASAVGKHYFCVNTSFVESFHNVILIYAPKRKHFHNSGYDSRVYLSALDWGENIKRKHIVNPDNPRNKWLPPKTYNFQLRVVETMHGNVMWAVPK